MRINISTIPHSSQRYSTTGDYVKVLQHDIITVSDMGNKDYEFLVAIHELVEMFLTQRNNISEESISNWDTEHPELDEPGDSTDAPYHKEHMIASKIERMLADEMGINWEEYTKTMDSLYK